MAEKFVVKVSGPGVAVEQTTSEEVAREVLVLVLGGTAARDITPPSKPAGQKHSGQGDNAPPLSIREFLDAHNTRTAPAKITAIGQYLREHDGAEVFTNAQMLQGFEDAHEPAPANPSRDIKKTIELGWIAPKRDAADTYYVTGSGAKQLQANFGESGGRKPRKKGGKKKAAKAATKK